eukprot:2410328-Amphidinium_carterae.1
MELLANIFSLDFAPKSEWERQLIAIGALRDDDKVDVQLFVAAMSVSGTDANVMPEVGLPASNTVSQADTGVVVSVASKHYEIVEKLGRGAGGSVHRATPRREAADTGAGLGQGGGPDSVALKLAGEGGAVGFRPKDTQLAAIAVEA